MKMIIDTDPGVDDAMAILYASLDPRIELLGLTTIFGNVTVETATKNALHLVEMAGLDIPVSRGAEKPMSLPPFPPSDHVHGAEGFGDLPKQNPQRTAIDEPATKFLSRMAREHKGELVICAIGPITNIAEAIVEDPEFALNVHSIVFMGGAAFVPGNVSRFAEANTYHDPHALNIVINSGANVTMVGLDITMKILCTDDDFAKIEQTSPVLGGFLRDASRFYLNYYLQSAGHAGCGMHDAAAVIACIDPYLFDKEYLRIRVVEDGEAAGQTQPTTEMKVNQIYVCTGGELTKIKERFVSQFVTAQAADAIAGWEG